MKRRPLPYPAQPTWSKTSAQGKRKRLDIEQYEEQGNVVVAEVELDEAGAFGADAALVDVIADGVWLACGANTNELKSPRRYQCAERKDQRDDDEDADVAVFVKHAEAVCDNCP